ncbi:hypothetical protein F5J12DRAFT_783542 [Pisolithus orientalis]|uniref:uncharacterized protein n=1 Tax=Pisolithus orientalis TaxID=936130 RepID=UPI002224B7C0|nr:uncharacterized protein F5J12DRAFT_783542 [Pisolithus orientalis]KAI6003472.1 hypothetical protein F5J12DRAFT_783542 [Pisolithus orientalis]
MRDQAITLLVAALRHVRVLINTAPQPEESLEAIYKWVEDWDQTWGQAARGEGQDHAPEDTEGNPSRGAACSTGEGSGSASKGKGKQKATSKEDELADDVDNDEGDGEPGPPAKGPCAAGDDEPCETCAQANLACIREPEASCKWCRKAKCKCLHSRSVGRKQKNSSTVGEAGPSHKQVKSFTTSKLAPAESATEPVKKLTLKIPA